MTAYHTTEQLYNFTTLLFLSFCGECYVHYGHCRILMGVSYNFEQHYWFYDKTGMTVPNNRWVEPPRTNEILMHNINIKLEKERYSAKWMPVFGTE